ncbi:MAG: CocE/NonD family hydrolase [Ahrensia sp.]|nr:CocE/NonD family hydrolase [Ahrensia sp.]
MKTISDFPRQISDQQHASIVMSDGVKLSARIWMPVDALDDPVPVILEHLPYRKRDGTVARDELTHPWFAGHGYACIRTDMRGNGESEGQMEDEYTHQEWQDAVDVIEWAAAQPWCNGNVGMMGISWGGFNGLQIAALKPEPLKAVISICSTADRYADDIHYKGGCLLGANFSWASQMLSYSSRPPDRDLVGSDWKHIWLERLENQPFHLIEWLRHQHRDAYWEHGSICEDYGAMDAAVLAIGGWHDGYRNTPAHIIANVKAPAKAIVGPWIHKYPHFAGPQPAIGFLQEAKRWWDRWLKDIDTGVDNDPSYRAWLMDSVAPKKWLPDRPGRWIAEAQWPSPNIADMVLHLNDEGRLTQTAAAVSAIVSSPQHCGQQGGSFFPAHYSDEFPDEQSADDAHSTCFDGDVADDVIDLVGAPHVMLTVSSDRPSGQIAVRLCDLRPDGTSALVTYGVFNLTHHATHAAPSSLAPGEAVSLDFALDQIAYRLPAGHRLRVAISSAYWPFIWPSPDAGVISIHKGSISLPVRALASGDEWSFEEPEAAPPWPHEVLRPAAYAHRIEMDETSGMVTTVIDCDSGENRDSAHGLVSGSWTKERWSIYPDDPLSAKATAEWEQTGGREGTMWRTHVKALMTSDANQFHISARLTAFHNGQRIHERVYEDSIDRA